MTPIPARIQDSIATLGCRPLGEDSDTGWKNRFFPYRLTKDGTRRRVFTMFGSKSSDPNAITLWQRFDNIRNKFFATSRACPKRRHCGPCGSDEEAWGAGSWIEYTIMVAIAAFLLVSSIGLTVFWVHYYRGGFAGITGPDATFNLHPVSMIFGFIVIGGFGMLIFRILGCFNRITVKLIHTVIHAFTAPCAVAGVMFAIQYHKKVTPPMKDFFSLHSWMGLITLVLYVLEYLLGIIMFFMMNCLGDASSKTRMAFIPVHTAFGVAIFVLAVTTCLTGINQRAVSSLGHYYMKFAEEGILMNCVGMLLIFVCFFTAYILGRQKFKICPSSEAASSPFVQQSKDKSKRVKGDVKKKIGIIAEELGFCPDY